MKAKVQRLFLAVAAAAITAFLLSCGAPPKPAAKSPGAKIEPRTNGTRGGKITYRLTAPPSTLNYLMAKDEAGLTASYFMLMSRLAEFDHSTQKFVPGLAESWTTTDGQNYDVKLRDGLQFSDGHPLTADDVIFSLTAMLDDKVKSPAFGDAMKIDDKPITATKVDDTHLKFVFPKPVASAEPYFVNLGVLPQHILGDDLKAGKLAEDWKVDSDPTKIVTSGPFIVTASKPGERIEYSRNPHYYKKDSAGTQLPYLDNVTIVVVTDPNNTFAQLSQGGLDIGDRIRTNDFVELNKANGQVKGYDAGPGLAIDHIFFNENTAGPNGPLGNDVKRAWFANKAFRTAIASAIDREDRSAKDRLRPKSRGENTRRRGLQKGRHRRRARPAGRERKQCRIHADRSGRERGSQKHGGVYPAGPCEAGHQDECGAARFPVAYGEVDEDFRLRRDPARADADRCRADVVF
jgi:ABC-type transport system substrate-binding protein